MNRILPALVPLVFAWLANGVVAQPVPSSSIFEGPAQVAAMQVTSIASKVPGQVTDILVEVGDVVRAGDVLATLDEHKYRLEVERARARLNLVKAQIDEWLEEHGKSMRLPSMAQADQEMAEAELDVAEFCLASTTIRAPRDGTVLKRWKTLGSPVDQSVTLAEITDLRALQVTLFVPETVLNRVRAGQECLIWRGATQSAHRGEVLRIEPMAKGSTGSFGVHIKLLGPTEPIKLGSRVRVSILE